MGKDDTALTHRAGIAEDECFHIEFDESDCIQIELSLVLPGYILCCIHIACTWNIVQIGNTVFKDCFRFQTLFDVSNKIYLWACRAWNLRHYLAGETASIHTVGKAVEVHIEFNASDFFRIEFKENDCFRIEL